MMQDFVLPASGGAARRLIQLSEVTAIDLTPEILELAKADILGDAEFQPLPVQMSQLQRETVQTLVDYQMRGILLADSTDGAREALVVAALLTKSFPLVISTTKTRYWTGLAERFGLTIGEDPLAQTDILMVQGPNLLKQDVIRDRRNGLLVVDNSDRTSSEYVGSEYEQNVSREFAKTVVIANFGSLTRTFHSWTRQCDLALNIALEQLWSSEILKILQQTPATVADLKRRGFKKFRAANLYFMFNVIPNLLEDRGPK